MTSISSNSQPQSPPRDLWKRKYEALEAQVAVTKTLGPTAKSFVSINLNNRCYSNLSLYRAAANQVSLGRAVRRTVDMFHSPRELVDEYDRRLDLIETGDEDDIGEE